MQTASSIRVKVWTAVATVLVVAIIMSPRCGWGGAEGRAAMREYKQHCKATKGKSCSLEEQFCKPIRARRGEAWERRTHGDGDLVVFFDYAQNHNDQKAAALMSKLAHMRDDWDAETEGIVRNCYEDAEQVGGH